MMPNSILIVVIVLARNCWGHALMVRAILTAILKKSKSTGRSLKDREGRYF